MRYALMMIILLSTRPLFAVDFADLLKRNKELSSTITVLQGIRQGTPNTPLAEPKWSNPNYRSSIYLGKAGQRFTYADIAAQTLHKANAMVKEFGGPFPGSCQAAIEGILDIFRELVKYPEPPINSGDEKFWNDQLVHFSAAFKAAQEATNRHLAVFRNELDANYKAMADHVAGCSQQLEARRGELQKLDQAATSLRNEKANLDKELVNMRKDLDAMRKEKEELTNQCAKATESLGEKNQEVSRLQTAEKQAKEILKKKFLELVTQKGAIDSTTCSRNVDIRPSGRSSAERHAVKRLTGYFKDVLTSFQLPNLGRGTEPCLELTGTVVGYKRRYTFRTGTTQELELRLFFKASHLLRGAEFREFSVNLFLDPNTNLDTEKSGKEVKGLIDGMLRTMHKVTSSAEVDQQILDAAVEKAVAAFRQEYELDRI